MVGAPAIESELERLALTGRPLAVNLLLPFARRSWFEAAAEADVVVTFWGTPRRRVPGCWLHQCGSVEEALEAQAAGADGVILQGVEAGGHVAARRRRWSSWSAPALRLGSGYPMLLAGGIAERADAVRAGVGSGRGGRGNAVPAGRRAPPHPEYRRRLLAADRTILTELFGAGWPAPHRVVANAATDRWLDGDGRGPALNRAATRPAGARRALRAPGRAAVDGPGPAPAAVCSARRRPRWTAPSRCWTPALCMPGRPCPASATSGPPLSWSPPWHLEDRRTPGRG